MASTTYAAIIEEVTSFLTIRGSSGPESSTFSKEVVDHVRKKITAGDLLIDVADATILQYVSHAARNDESSRIVSGGPHGGYWIEPVAELQDEPPLEEQTETLQGAAGGVPVKALEKDLYPLMALWLEQKGYQSKDISSLKSGGPWGNPDILGVRWTTSLGATEIELASCEVKLNQGGWQQSIFEAVSHKRFTNRSWFCYRVKVQDDPMPKGMEYYAERFKVGVVQMSLTDEEFAGLKEGTRKPIEFVARVSERVPAIHEWVPLREQRELIERAQISLGTTLQ